MKISYKWIKEYISVDQDAYEVAHALTMSGTEIEGIEHLTIPEQVVVARITEVAPHPNADKLRICQVDAGQESHRVVCGAPNVKEGMLSAFAPVGTQLSEEFKVKKAKIRGEESFGILLSEKELGLTDDHDGIMEITGDHAPGDCLMRALDLEDWAFEVNVTPNRGDCLSVLGLARELSAIYRTDIKLPEFKLNESGSDINEKLAVEIIDRDLCPRYAARMLEGVSIGKSPFAMRRRLFISDIRAINNMVDITNYILLELGQPMHAFDYTLLEGAKIVVKKASAGEKFTTLDSQERELCETDLMICDAVKPVALAGVMGGENSEVKDETSTVVLESAFFEPVTIRKTAKRLSLSSEASYRFERGIDPEGQVRAADRAAYLMSELAGATVLPGVIDVNYVEQDKPAITLRQSYLERVLGAENVKVDEVADIMQRLGCKVISADGRWEISAPLFRHDLEREADMLEEYIRIYGMDRVAPKLPPFVPEPLAAVEVQKNDLRRKLADMGLSEIVTYSFISPRWKAVFGEDVLELKNPISEELSIMRRSLIPALATTVARNRNQQAKDIFIYELGRCYLPKGEVLPVEDERLAIALSGSRRPGHFSEASERVDFYDIKGYAEALIDNMALQKSDRDFLKPGYQADIIVKGRVVGFMGALNSSVLEMEDIDDDVFVMEVDLSALVAAPYAGMQSLARFPMTSRDLSLVADENISYAQINELITGLKIEELRKVEVIDLYEGDKLPEGKRGITIRLVYQSSEKTLADKQISKWQDSIIKKLADEFNITLRQ